MAMIIGMDSWIIQDGNYSDFRVGEIREFALEFYPISLGNIESKNTITPKKGDLYEINGKVDYVDNDSWVIDFGLKAFQESSPPEGIKIGDKVSGVFYLGVDPFFYFERLKDKAGFPDITYKWQIEKIEMETTPFIETAARTFERDKTKESYIEITETNAWEDFEGSACYLLYCKKL